MHSPEHAPSSPIQDRKCAEGSERGTETRRAAPGAARLPRAGGGKRLPLPQGPQSSKPRSPTLLETCDATEGMNACQMGMKTAGAASRLLPAFPKPRPRAPAPAERKPTENRRSESALPRSRPGHLHFPRSRPRREKNRRWENSVPRQKKAGAPYTAKNGVPPSVGGSASLKGGPPHRRISTGRRRSGLDVILAGPP